MNLNTIRETIIESTPDYWNTIICWGAGSGPVYHYGLSSEVGDHGIETEAQGHSTIAVLIDDVDISIAWGYDPDETLAHARHPSGFSFDFLPADLNEDPSRMYADVFYRGALVDRALHVVADGGRHYVPIPRRVGEERHYTRWDIGFARILNSLAHIEPFDALLSRLDYVLDDGGPGI